MNMKHVIAALALGLAVAAGAVTARAQSGYDLFQKALAAERADGNLRAAIQLYTRVVKEFGSDRALAARALVRMAECYEKLGDSEAQRVYQQIVLDFGDQTEAIAVARARLGSRGGAARGDRVVKAGELVTFGEGRVSPDGRFISYVDYHFTGNLMLHDLVAGTDRALTGNKDWSGGSAYASTFSPDGKQAAYGWRTFGTNGGMNDVRVVRIDAAGLPQPRRVYGSEDVEFFHPTDWSPDGRLLAVRVRRKDGTGQIALVGLQDGAFRVLKTVGWRGPNKIFFSPDGKYLAYDLPPSDAEAQRDVFVIAVDGSRETQIVEHPADDAVMGWAPGGGRLLFASDRTGAFGLWALPVADGKPHGAPTLLKPDIGSIMSQGLTAAGALYLVKDASTLSLQIAPIDLEAGKLTGPPVLENFRSDRPDWSRDGRQLAYRTTGVNGLPALVIRAVDTGRLRELKPALVYFAEPQWLPDASGVIAAGRDFSGREGIYRIDAQTGRATRLADASAVERVQISPDGTKIYYTEASNTKIVERELATGIVRDLYQASTRVGAVNLSPDGRLIAFVPIEYAATTSTLMVMPVVDGEPQTVFRLSAPEGLPSYGGVSWTPDNRRVIVVTGTDRYDPVNFWLIPVDGRTPRKLDIDVRSWKTIGGVRLRPHGDQIAFFLGQDSREVVALESFLPALRATR